MQELGKQPLIQVQIPCLNERETISEILGGLSRFIVEIEGASPKGACVQVVLIDDGSSDGTHAVAIESARRFGISTRLTVLRRPHQGLAAAYQAGIAHAIDTGAEIVVNLDGDNQYPICQIPRLLNPVIRGQADLVVGERALRPKWSRLRFRWILRWLGSPVISRASSTVVRDVTSGFRVMSTAAARRAVISSPRTYTIDAVLSAGRTKERIATVPIVPNESVRPSRLIRSVWPYLWHANLSLIRHFVLLRSDRAHALSTSRAHARRPIAGDSSSSLFVRMRKEESAARRIAPLMPNLD